MTVLTIEECAKELKVSADEVLSLIDNHELDAKVIGSKYRIPEWSFHKYLGVLPSADGRVQALGEHVTLSDWADRWLLIYKKSTVTENTYNGTYRHYVEAHIKPFFGDVLLGSIKPLDIQQFYTFKNKLSVSALSKIAICLNGIFDTAIDNDLCLKNPAKAVSFKSLYQPTAKRVYTHEQEERVYHLSIDQLPGITLCLETGMRPGEYTGLRWDDISNDVLHVSRSIAFSKENKYIIRPPKWDSYRDIPLTPRAKEALARMKNDDIYVYPYAADTPYTTRAWDKTVERFFKKMDDSTVPHLTPHEFRHTFGTKLRRNGVDIYTIQKLMGHKSIKVTTETYVHNEIDVLIKAMGL